MKKRILFISTLLLSAGVCAASPTSEEILKQLAKNAHGGVEVHKIDNQTSYSGYVGTGYQYYFYKQKAYVKPEIEVKWGEYRYQDNYHVQTTSLAIPITVGYNLFQETYLGMNLFGGIRYEQILRSSNNTYEYGVNTSQVGLTAGTSVRLLNKFSINVSYYYGLTSLYSDGSGRISSFNFSFNF